MAISLSPSKPTQLLAVCCLLTTALVLQSTSSYTLVHANNVTDQRALLSFKLSTNDPMNEMSNWHVNTSFCSWNGVSCSRRRQRVVALNLVGKSLQGTISPYLANLSFLHVLNLSFNHFHGILPLKLGQLSRLQIIDLAQNNMEGEIPQSLCLCSGLQRLKLSHNQFEGAIAACLGNLPDLEYLSLSENSLSGSIPEEFGSLTNLNMLNVGSNNLTGEVPQCVFNISTLQVLVLQHNNLIGHLPENIGFMLPNLQKLVLDKNGFSGQIPRSLGNAVNLTTLYLGRNKFIGTTIPPFLANLSKLESLDLSMLGMVGNIPDELWSLSRLDSIYLQYNNLIGTISPSLANLSELEHLEVGHNRLTGSIPATIGMLPKLKFLSLGHNNLTGTIPPSIFNLSNVQDLSVINNSLTGYLPHDLGSMLPNLQLFFLNSNSFDGQIPASLANATNLEIISLAYNKFSGPIPLELGRLAHLKILSLGGNFLTNIPDTNELSIFTALTNCRNLEALHLSYNSLSGTLPTFVGNLSSSIKILWIQDNQIRGTIPEEITNLTNLNSLDLSNNNISGIIPSNIGRLHNLQGLFLSDNGIEGLIPPQFYQMVSLVTVDMSGNKLSGPISSSISNMSNLQELYLHSNNFSSMIPPSFWQLKDLGSVYLQDNSLTGSLPVEIGNLDKLYQMDLSANKLFGDLPASLVNLQMLEYLNLSKNSFSGHIPEKLDAMVNLKAVDLSYNLLSGEIPKAVSLLRGLKSLNLSFNQLEGEIPNGGIFANLTADSFVGNYGLCGAPKFEVPQCPNKNKKHKQPNLTIIIVASTLGGSAFIFLVALAIIKSCQDKVAVPNDLRPVEPVPRTQHLMVSYRELVHATNNFDDSNLIGSGSFGSVYKGILSDGTTVAVKVFNLLFEGILNSFKIECEVLSKARHRNLLQVISSCTNEEFKALILQYMPRGSLENCLYVSGESLNLVQRLNIMIDVACAMEYLHHDFFEHVLHCDLKPSNVLLDSEMVAYVADFGLAKMLVGSKSSTLTETLGTTGYIAPEFGLGGKVSTKADVYSYGVLLLEMFTRKKPTDAMFTGDLSLTQWVAEALPDAVLNVVDGCLLDNYAGSSHSGQREGVRSITRNELLVSIMRVGLLCSRESPAERTNMRQVVADLKKIREKLIRNLETANMARNVSH